MADDTLKETREKFLVGLEEMARNISASLYIPLIVTCPRCKGHGGDPEDHQVVAHVPEQAPCRDCHGTGVIES